MLFLEDECGISCRLIAVFVSFVGAWICYGMSCFVWNRASVMYRSLPADEKAAWDTRTVSTLHSIVTGVWAIICLTSATYHMPSWSVGQPTSMYVLPAEAAHDAVLSNGTGDMGFASDSMIRGAKEFFFGGNYQMELMLCASLGYFLQDSLVIMGVRGALWKYEDLVHHVTVLANLMTALIARTFLPYITWVYLAELSTPLHNLRYYLERFGRSSMVLDATFSLIFLVVRPISFTWLIVHIVQHFELWSHSFAAYMILAVACFFFALNYYWTLLVIRGIVDALKPKKIKPE